ncbi:DUF418 domain-containing protein [Alkaliflexus imshenetskii]|jgi:uncharacterized protein|uniref:DUF418 domain-containing protein n=1 Tax=Alkaliflexus imshenetskii TaxID=286730 RepID=UPI00047C4D89|nr:DUF418 domain-containing protein [Alkaliflexus imshenetskii]
MIDKASRFDVVDALRGFAILSIMLLHNIEHFDMYHLPDTLPEWIKAMDTVIWDALFFMFGGKSYAIFALLFGLTFHIQMSNRQKDGYDFGMRFLWRLLLLFGFGFINSLFYHGDILAIYALIGISLVPVRHLSNRAVLIIATILMLQPLEWGKIIYIISNPEYITPARTSYIYFGNIHQYLGDGSFTDAVIGNLTNGRTAVFFWSLEEGRYFQTASLFMLGMLLGRQQLFAETDKSKTFWLRTLLFATVIFIPLYIFVKNIPEVVADQTLHFPLTVIFKSWSNFAFMMILVSLFVLSYRHSAGVKLFGGLRWMGRMSLTNYIMQSILGSFIYYGYGLGMYLHTGATYSLLIGIALATIQMLFSRWWFTRHKMGPLENIWHRATWI